MRKSLTYKILAAVMAAGSLGLYVAAPAAADDYTVKKDGEIISSGTFTNVYGNGYSFTINGGTINGRVFGVGNENYTEDVSGGNVTINGNAYIAGAVYGGRSGKGEAYNNTVNISGGSVSGYVYGGFSQNSSAYSNTVNISGYSELGQVRGGYSYSGEAYDNTVNISGGSVSGYVYGGNSYSREAHHNTVNISGGSVGGSIGAVYGGRSYSGEAYNNTVNISDGSVGDVRGGYSGNGEVYDNTVNISGGSVSGDVYGGYSEMGSANDNEIIIRGSADITNANLYGRNDSASGTGNTLTIDGWSGSTKSVQNFNDIAFKNINWNENKPVLTITAGSADDLTNTTIDTINIAGGSNINVGESMTLIKNNGTLNSIGNVTDTFTAGVAREGLGSTSVDTTTGEVSFKVNSIKLSSQAVWRSII